MATITAGNNNATSSNFSDILCSFEAIANRSGETNILNTLSVAAAAVGLSSSFLSIVIVLATRSCDRFVRRLYLYLSLAGAWLSVGQFWYWGEGETFSLLWVTHYSYGLIAYALLIVWVGLHIFVLVVCKIKLIDRERVFLGGVLLVPLLVCWIPALVFGLRWERILCDAGLALVPIAAFVVAACLVSGAALAVVAYTLLRAIFSRRSAMPAANKRVLLELLPVFVLVLVVQVTGVLLLFVYAYYAAVGAAIYYTGNTSTVVYRSIIFCLPGVFLLGPILLIVDISVQRFRKSRRVGRIGFGDGDDKEKRSITDSEEKCEA